jgi:RNA polymerase sigma-70 factor (ECF subfamily)
MITNKKTAFETLALPLMDKLYSYALRLTGDQMDAEDLVQETYLKAFRFFSSYKSGSNFQAWLFRILTNSYIDFYHKKKRRVNQFVHSEQEFEGEDPLYNEWIDWKESGFTDVFGDEINRALNNIPEHYRTVVLLSDVNDFKYKEIAKILNCPIGTVMSRLNRGRRLLAKQLRDYASRAGALRQVVSNVAA